MVYVYICYNNVLKGIIMASLSISIVLYNNKADTLDGIIKNISNVTRNLSKVDLFLVNNSPSNVQMKQYLEKYSSLRWVHVISPKVNNGFGSGNNLVLPYLRSDYHLIMNPDIFIKDENQVDMMVSYLKKHPHVGLLAPLIKFPNGEVQHLLKRKSTLLDMAIRFVELPGTKKRRDWFVNLPDGYEHTHEAENVPGSFLFFRTDVFKKIQGFDEKYFLYMEDCDITMKVNQISSTVFFPEATVYHEWQRANRKTAKGILQMMSSMVIYFNKWGWKLW